MERDSQQSYLEESQWGVGIKINFRGVHSDSFLMWAGYTCRSDVLTCKAGEQLSVDSALGRKASSVIRENRLVQDEQAVSACLPESDSPHPVLGRLSVQKDDGALRVRSSESESQSGRSKPDSEWSQPHTEREQNGSRSQVISSKSRVCML